MQQAKGRNGDDGHRDRGGDGQPGTQSEIGVGRTEQDAEQDPGESRLEGELRRALTGRDIRLVDLAFGERLERFRAQTLGAGHQWLLSQ